MVLFPKGARFLNTPATDVPGPGAYDVPIALPDPAYKKGAMLEKAGRFAETMEGEGPGVGVPEVENKENKRLRPPSTAGVGAERARVQMDDLKHKLQTSHEKDLAKLTAKLARSELARTELVSQQSASKAEVTSLKHEVRTLTTSLTKSSASLAKHTTTLPLLQSQLSALTTSHATSHARKDAELATLRESLSTLSTTLSTTSTSLDEALSALSTALTSHAALSHTASTLLTQRDDALDVAKWDLIASRKRVHRLERQLSQREAQVTELVSYSQSLESRLEESHSRASEAEKEVEWWVADVRWFEGAGKRGEKEWRQRCRSELREREGLREVVKGMGEEGKVWNGLEGMLGDWRGERVVEEVEGRERAEEEREVAEGNYEWASAEVERLAEELERAMEEGARVGEVEEERDELRALLEREREEGLERAGEMEELRRGLEERRKEVDKAGVEKRRLVVLLGEQRAAEQGLLEELAGRDETIAHLQGVELAARALEQQVDELSRRTAAAEEDVRELGEMNNKLLGHENPHQKIRQVAAIRTALSESRRNHLTTTSLLAASTTENSRLVAELQAYRSIGTNPSLSRSRVSRPRIEPSLPQIQIDDQDLLRIEEEFGDEFESRVEEEEGMEESRVRRAGRERREGVDEQRPPPSPLGGGVRMGEGRMRIEDLW